MIFYVFFETDGDYGVTFGFTTEAARHAWITEQLRLLALTDSDDLSDLEEWERPIGDPTWSHIRILA